MDNGTWQEALAEVVDRHMTFDRMNLERLYIDLEHASQKFVKENLIPMGEVFPIPMESGNILEFRSYGNYSTLHQVDPRGITTTLVDKKASVTHEYQTLWAVESALYSTNMGIGFHYPPELPDYLRSINIGEVFVSNSKHGYVCTNKDSSGTVIFQEICPKYYTPDIDDFKKMEPILVVTTSPISVQEFFRRTKERVPESATYRYTTLTESQEFINRIFAGIGDDIRQVDIGPNTFYVHKIGKDLVWLDHEGEPIDEETVKVYIAWLNAAPVVTDYRMRSEGVPDFEERGFAIELESLFSSHNYDDAFDLILKYCKERNDNHIFEMRTYTKDGDHFKAVSFSAFPPGLEKLMMSEFWDEDFSKRKNRVEVSKEQFKEFCEKKYEESCAHFENAHLKSIMEKYPRCSPTLAKNIAKSLTEKQAGTDFVKMEIDNV